MGQPADFVTLPSVPPIYQTAAFDLTDLEMLQDIVSGNSAGHIYTRDSNPNHAALAESIAALEGTAAGAVFASGMGAISSIFLTLAGSGDHVIMSRALYGKTLQLAERMQQRFGIELTAVDVADPAAFRSALRERTRFAIVETISNPLLQIADIRQIAAVMEGVPLVVDATFTTPELSRPCQLGASIVVHSASKYLNGHGDVMLGVAAGTREMMQRLNETASIFGQNANPFESWLCQRGLRTLPLRIKQICQTTNRLAQLLASHPAVRRVHHPLLPDHPSHAIAKELYPEGTGGIIAFELCGAGGAVVNRFMQNCRNIPFSPTLADLRTTISYPAGTSHRFMTSEGRAAVGISDELVRLSVGLEPFELLAQELQSALQV